MLFELEGKKYAFAPGVDAINTIDQDGKAVTYSLSEIESKYEKDKDFKSWIDSKIKDKSLLFVPVSAEQSKAIDTISALADENEALKAKLAALEAKTEKGDKTPKADAEAVAGDKVGPQNPK